jgi:aminomuconate-semialdehyde/2-hydroxymuconate-6-semialdehyde dehydrogenase
MVDSYGRWTINYQLKIMDKILNYIGGELVEPSSANYLDNIEPATGKVYSQIPDSDSADIETAVAAAKKAQEGWATMPAENRSALLMKVADLIDRDLEELARAESIDNGKPISLARTVDIPRASSNFRFYAAAIINFSSHAHITPDKGVN